MVDGGAQLDNDEKKLLVGYLMRREMAKAFGGQTLADGATTVGEAIDAQKKWAANLSESEQKAAELKAEVEQQRKAIAEQINKIVTVAFIDAIYLPSEVQSGHYDDSEVISFAVKNRGKKKIKGLKGHAVFIDTFGDEYLRLGMQVEEPIGQSQQITQALSWDVNEFMDDGKKLMALDSEKKFRFEPTHIVFEDGSTLKAPDRPE